MTSRTDRIESREDRRAARRDQLLDDAMAAIRETGAGATMEQLARRGGVTKPILYRHFGDRDGLITTIAERFAGDLLGSVESALENPLAPRDLLATTIDAYLAFIEREPALYRFVLQQTIGPGGLVNISPLIDRIARRVAVVLGEQLRLMGLDSGAAVPWSFGIVGMVHQAGDWWLEDRTLPRPRLTEYLTGLLWDGLAGTASEPEGGSAPEAPK
jgi:AcrR family transcriptional regulator